MTASAIGFDSMSEKKSLGKKIAKATLLIAVANLLFKLAGLIQAKVMGHCLSAGDFDVMYSFAFQNCIFGLFLIGEEGLAPAFMPTFMEEADKDERGGWRFANSVLSLQTVVLVAVVALLMLFPESVVRIWTDWTPEADPDRFRLGAFSIRWQAPALIGLSLGTTTYVLLNAHKRFFLAAFGDAAWKFAVVVALLCGCFLFGADAGRMLVVGLVAGATLKFATHLAGLHDKLRFMRPRFDWASPAMKRLYLLALPLLAGIVFAKFRDAFNNVYVLSKVKGIDGLMQANSVGRMLQGTIHTLVPLTLSTAVFPFLCELVDQKDSERLAEVLTHAGRLLLAVFIPFVAVLAVLATPLTHFIFHGGEFTGLAVRRAALSTALYTLVLPASAIEALAMRGFFANRRMVAVTVAGIVFSSISMLASWLGLRYDDGSGWIALAAIAGGFSLTRLMKSVALVFLLRKSAPVFPPRETIAFLAKVAVVAAASCAVAYAASRACSRLPFDPALLGGRIDDAARLAIGGGCGALAALAGCWLLRVREPFEIVGIVFHRRRSVGAGGIS